MDIYSQATVATIHKIAKYFVLQTKESRGKEMMNRQEKAKPEKSKISVDPERTPPPNSPISPTSPTWPLKTQLKYAQKKWNEV